MNNDVMRVTPDMQEAWMAWDYEPHRQLTPGEWGRLRTGFMAGYAAALAIEAGTDTTGTGVAEGESAGPQDNAQGGSHDLV